MSNYAVEGALALTSAFTGYPKDSIVDRQGRTIPLSSVASAWAAADLYVESVILHTRAVKTINDARRAGAEPEMQIWLELLATQADRASWQALILASKLYDLHSLAPQAASTRMIRFGLTSGLSHLSILGVSGQVYDVQFQTTDQMRNLAQQMLDALVVEFGGPTNPPPMLSGRPSMGALPTVIVATLWGVGIVAGAIVIYALGKVTIAALSAYFGEEHKIITRALDCTEREMRLWQETGDEKHHEAMMVCAKLTKELAAEFNDGGFVLPAVLGGLGVLAAVWALSGDD